MNRSQARTEIRTRLSDPASAGLWSDESLDVALRSAFGALAPRFPLRSTAPVSVAAGDVTVTIASPGRVVFLHDGQGRSVPAVTPVDSVRFLAWHRRDDDTLGLSRPVRSDEAGSWTLGLLDTPIFPATDTDDFALPGTIAGALVASATAVAIRARLADDAKRSRKTMPHTVQLARDCDAEARAITAAHFRTAKGGTLGAS